MAAEVQEAMGITITRPWSESSKKTLY